MLGWAISDGLKVVLNFILVVLVLLQLRDKKESKNAKRVKILTIFTGIFGALFQAGAHEPFFFGWKFYTVFLHLYTISLMAMASFIAYLVSNVATKLSHTSVKSPSSSYILSNKTYLIAVGFCMVGSLASMIAVSVSDRVAMIAILIAFSTLFLLVFSLNYILSLSFLRHEFKKMMEVKFASCASSRRNSHRHHSIVRPKLSSRRESKLGQIRRASVSLPPKARTTAYWTPTENIISPWTMCPPKASQNVEISKPTTKNDLKSRMSNGKGGFAGAGHGHGETSEDLPTSLRLHSDKDFQTLNGKGTTTPSLISPSVRMQSELSPPSLDMQKLSLSIGPRPSENKNTPRCIEGIPTPLSSGLVSPRAFEKTEKVETKAESEPTTAADHSRSTISKYSKVRSHTKEATESSKAVESSKAAESIRAESPEKFARARQSSAPNSPKTRHR
ncbi:hypothetical protein AAMO2058_000978100 [Amorphochlora amoebiformis]